MSAFEIDTLTKGNLNNNKKNFLKAPSPPPYILYGKLKPILKLSFSN